MGLVSSLKAWVGPRKPKFDMNALKRAIPVATPGVTVSELDDGGIVLEAPLSASPGRVAQALAKWANAPTTKKFELEPVGAFVWSLCDGEHTVEAISRKIQSRYRMNRLESDAALAAFLQTLSQRGLIRVKGANK